MTTFMLWCKRSNNALTEWETETEALGFADAHLTDAPDAFVVLAFGDDGLATRVVWPRADAS